MKSLEPIFLTGFSGVGKTTVGASLAASLGRIHVDLDQRVEKASGDSLAALWEKQGESEFRRLETTELQRISLEEGPVVSLGGGTLLAEKNLEYVKQSGRLIYLKSQIMKSRLAARLPTRPHLGDFSDSILERLFKAREPGYEAAHLVLNVEGLGVAEMSSLLERVCRSWTRI